ncbi:FlgO family outer membrane protein [Alteromonas sp. KUL49]|uniref:FlgO family outer membrane protein n=1 Tax=Alteromonas sp. KUL49 TaxID=2480798 RepID=UPI0010FFB1D7|nr:FlgO family outer membrane protein [Alteromonas sp. KUL49]GEA13327.1 hypothetical protein KUL49_37020 [Alteromonas sp. KUL49]
MAFKRTGFVSALMLMACLSGCAMSPEFSAFFVEPEPEPMQEPMYPANPSGFVYTPDSRDQEHAHLSAQEQTYRDPLHSGFAPSQTHKRLNDYASQLAMDLMENATQLTQDDLVGITSFVRFDATLSTSTVLGNQLSEYLIAELQDFGVSIVDFKLANGITVSPYGDFAMSRSAKYLASELAMDHLVTGTIIEDERGLRVNARIVSLENKQVMSSANIYIPAFIVTSLHKS